MPVRCTGICCTWSLYSLDNLIWWFCQNPVTHLLFQATSPTWWLQHLPTILAKTTKAIVSLSSSEWITLLHQPLVIDRLRMLPCGRHSIERGECLLPFFILLWRRKYRQTHSTPLSFTHFPPRVGEGLTGIVRIGKFFFGAAYCLQTQALCSSMQWTYQDMFCRSEREDYNLGDK